MGEVELFDLEVFGLMFPTRVPPFPTVAVPVWGILED